MPTPTPNLFWINISTWKIPSVSWRAVQSGIVAVALKWQGLVQPTDGSPFLVEPAMGRPPQAPFLPLGSQTQWSTAVVVTTRQWAVAGLVAASAGFSLTFGFLIQDRLSSWTLQGGTLKSSVLWQRRYILSDCGGANFTEIDPLRYNSGAFLSVYESLHQQGTLNDYFHTWIDLGLISSNTEAI